MRCTEHGNTKAYRDAATHKRSLLVFYNAVRSAWGQFVPLGSPPKLKRGKGAAGSATKIERRMFA